MAALTKQLRISTPEGVEFSFLLAGSLSRFIAWGIDIAMILLLLSILSKIIQLVGQFSGGLAMAFSILAGFIIRIGYAIAFEWMWRGQTVGKRLLKLRVIDESGLRLQFSQIVLRNLMRFIDGIPVLGFAGGVACFFSAKGQRMGDYAANTVVIREPIIQEPDLEALFADKYNSFREHPHLCARFRQVIPISLARIALQALMRREELEPPARIEVFKSIVNQLETHRVFPEHLLATLTDEQYIRNSVDVLYRGVVSPMKKD